MAYYNSMVDLKHNKENEEGWTTRWPWRRPGARRLGDRCLLVTEEPAGGEPMAGRNQNPVLWATSII